jgi:hypothetical protein
MPPCQGSATTGTYAGGESWRGCMPGRAGGDAKNHRCRHGRKWNRSSCRGHAAPGPLIPSGATWCRRCAQNQPDRLQRTPTRTSMTGDLSALSLKPCGEACNGSGETTSVIDTINRRACNLTEESIGAGFPVLILTVPNNPIRHSCTESDYNCGATLIHAGMCVHVFSIEFACLRGRWSAPLCKISF